MLELVLTVHVARDETTKPWPFHRFGRAGSRETRGALVSAIAASDENDGRRGFDRWELIRTLFAALIIEGLVDDVAEGREPDLETAHRNLLADCAKSYPMFVGVRAAGNLTVSEVFEAGRGVAE